MAGYGTQCTGLLDMASQHDVAHHSTCGHTSRLQSSDFRALTLDHGPWQQLASLSLMSHATTA
jgi:hypothetical protein